MADPNVQSGSTSSSGSTIAPTSTPPNDKASYPPSDSSSADYTLKRRPWRRQVTPWSAIIEHKYKGSGTDEDPFIVEWVTNDPEYPHSWSNKYKWIVTILAAVGTLSVGFGSSMLSAAITNLKMAFPGHNDMLYIMITGIYVLGFVVGPLIFAPTSEVIGRRKIFMISYIPFTAFNAAVCGANNLNALLVLRFCAGLGGSSTMVCAGGTIADCFDAAQRGLAMAVFAAMPMVGPAIGPLAGGFLSMAASWKWVAAVVAFFSLAVLITTVLFLPETYAPVLLRQRAQLLAKATGKVYRIQQDAAKPLVMKALFLTQLKVPFKLLFTEPIVAVTSLYLAVVYAILFMQFTSFPLVFQMYRHWSPGIAALAFIGIAVGSFLALFFIIFYENPRYARLHAKHGYLAPEVRLLGPIVGAICLPAGLFIFAWTCVPATIHWIAPVIATVLIGAGLILLFLGVSNYLVDSYLMLAASVIAAGTVTRSILGVVFPLFTVDMYTKLGPNWAGTLVACLAVVFVPVPLLLQMYGSKIRRMTKPGRDADDLGHMMVKMMAAKRAQAAAAASGTTAVPDSVAASPATSTTPLSPVVYQDGADEKKIASKDAGDEEIVLDSTPRLSSESGTKRQ